jgi:hypothetical protein
MATIATTTIPSNKIRSDLEEKIDSLTAGALPYFRCIFKQLALVNPQNADILSEFLTAEHTEHNIKLTTRLAHIKIICWFTRYSDYGNKIMRYTMTILPLVLLLILVRQQLVYCSIDERFVVG